MWVGVHGVVTGSWAVAPWLPSSQSVALSRNLYLPHLAQIARPPRSIARLASRRYLRGARSTWVLVLSGSQTRLRVPCPGQQEGSARPPSPPPAAPAVSIAARSSAAAPRTSSRRVPESAPSARRRPWCFSRVEDPGDLPGPPRRGHRPRGFPGGPPSTSQHSTCFGDPVPCAPPAATSKCLGALYPPSQPLVDSPPNLLYHDRSGATGRRAEGTDG